MYSQLKNQINFVCSHTQQGWNQTQNLIDCIQDRIEAELKYSKSMEKIAIRLASINEQYSSSFGLKASLAASLAEEIKSEQQALKDLLRIQRDKAQLDYIRLWDHQVESMKSELKQLEATLKQKKRDFEIEGVLDLIYANYGHEKAEKQRQKQMKLKIRAQSSRISFQTVMQKYKDLQKELQQLQSEKEVEQTLDTLQRFEIERQNTIKNSLMKIFVFESSLNRNHLYDLEKMTERIHEFDYEKQQKDFLQKHAVPENSKVVETESFLTHLLNNPFQQKLTDGVLELQGEEQAAQLRESATKCDEFLNYLALRFKGNVTTLSVQEFIQITNLSIALLDKVRMRLSQCEEEKNSFLVHRLVKYSFGICTQDTQKRYLQEMLINHCIWHCRDLWESIIIQQIAQLKEQRQDDKKTSILSILTQTSQHMVMFKLSGEIVRDIVLKFCSFFKIDSEMSMDLIVRDIYLYYRQQQVRIEFTKIINSYRGI